jgi:hypothetical protein
LSGYQISTEEYLASTVANAGDAAQEAGFLLQSIHTAYSYADKLQDSTGYTRSMAYKQLDAIRLTIEDDLNDVPNDPSTPIDQLALWWPPLARDIKMGWQTVRQVREKAGESVPLLDQITGAVGKTATRAADAVGDVGKGIALGTVLLLVVVGVLVILILRTPAAGALAGGLL